MNPDIVAAVVDYLRVVMAQQFGVTPTNQGVWGDKAGQDLYPYAVVQAPGETYERSSNDPSTGSRNTYIAVGTLNVLVHAYDSALAHSLARQVVGALDNDRSDGQLDGAMGRVIDMMPASCAALPPIDEGGTVSPVVYRRLVVFQYRQEFYL